MTKRTLVAAVALVSLAACDNGGVIDQTIHGSVRQSAVEACLSWIPQTDFPLPAGLDGQRVCACAVDRMLQVRSVTDLAGLRPDSAEGRAAIAQCLAQIQPEASG